MHFVFVERGFPRNNGEVGGASSAGDSIEMRKNAQNRILEMCSLQKNTDDRLELFQKLK